MNRTTGIVVMVSVALLSVAILVAAYMFTHKPEPDQSNAARIACYEGGGTWVPASLLIPGVSPGAGTCEH